MAQCNITDPFSCGTGTCLAAGCSCKSYYNPNTACSDLLSEVTGTATAVATALLLTFLLGLVVMIVLEIILDQRFHKIRVTWKDTLFIVKIGLLSACLILGTWRALELYQAVTNTLVESVLIVVLRMSHELVFTALYIFAVTNWISLILRAKNLQDNVPGLRIVRYILLGVAATWVPLYAISVVLVASDVGMPIMQVLVYTASGLLIFTMCALVSVFLYRACKFVGPERKSSKVMSKAYRKTRALLIILISFWVMLVQIMVEIATPTKGPWIQFISKCVTFVLTMVIYSGIFLFARNFRFNNYGQFITGREIVRLSSMVSVYSGSTTSTSTPPNKSTRGDNSRAAIPESIAHTASVGESAASSEEPRVPVHMVPTTPERPRVQDDSDRSVTIVMRVSPETSSSTVISDLGSSSESSATI